MNGWVAVYDRELEWNDLVGSSLPIGCLDSSAPLTSMVMAHTRSRFWKRIRQVWAGSYSYARELVDQIRVHRLSMLAKQAAYSLLYAIPALAWALVSLAGIIDKHVDADLSEALLTVIASQGN